MTIFDFLFRKRAPSPDRLRTDLFDAIAAHNADRFESLCEAHAELIVAHFESWVRVPEAIRAMPDSLQVYASTLIALAERFAARGNPDLMKRLRPVGRANPLERWPTDLLQARTLFGVGQLDAAEALTTSVLASMKGCVGTGVETYAPKAEGLLGEIHFRRGKLAPAEEHMLRALALCRASHDSEGVAVYCRNLAEICRVRGDEEGRERWLREK